MPLTCVHLTVISYSILATTKSQKPIHFGKRNLEIFRFQKSKFLHFKNQNVEFKKKSGF